MKKIVIAAATLALVAGSTAGFSASAQERPQERSSERRGERARPTVEDMAALSDSRIAALKTGLRLTPEQDKLWPAVETALKEVSQARIARASAAREARAQERATERAAERAPRGPSGSAAAPATPAAPAAPSSGTSAPPQPPAAQVPAPRPAPDTLDRLRTAADRLTSRADRLTADAADLRKIATAADPLYRTLDEAQKRRLDLMIREDLRGRMKARGHGGPRHGGSHPRGDGDRTMLDGRGGPHFALASGHN